MHTSGNMAVQFHGKSSPQYTTLGLLTYESDRLYDLVKILDPEGVALRRYDFQRHRGQLIIPGPNFLWSVDGYCKLDAFGFEIYGVIDAYSRFIVWIYIGVSAHTSISCVRQFLDTVKERKIIPRILRSDRGVETGLIAAAHHRLRQVHEPDISLNDCFFYGTSTKNQRIESWWGQFCKTLIYRWRVC